MKFNKSASKGKSENEDRLKRTFINSVLDYGFGVNISNKYGKIDEISIKDETSSLICLLNFEEHKAAPILMKHIGWIDTDKFYRLRMLYKSVNELLEELDE